METLISQICRKFSSDGRGCKGLKIKSFITFIGYVFIHDVLRKSVQEIEWLERKKKGELLRVLFNVFFDVSY